ncbi:MAG: hypothetical protein ACYCX2_00490 [Christensenellales bacterium]
MSVCPIISKPDKLSDCIAEECPFYDGCMILEAYDTANGCNNSTEELDGDIFACKNEVESLRHDFDGLVNAITED